MRRTRTPATNQMPITGTSFAYTLDDGAAPTQKPQQYFELAPC